MFDFGKPTWPKGLSKWSFIKFILQDKKLSKAQKISLVLLTIRMEETAMGRKW